MRSASLRGDLRACKGYTKTLGCAVAWLSWLLRVRSATATVCASRNPQGWHAAILAKQPQSERRAREGACFAENIGGDADFAGRLSHTQSRHPGLSRCFPALGCFRSSSKDKDDQRMLDIRREKTYDARSWNLALLNVQALQARCAFAFACHRICFMNTANTDCCGANDKAEVRGLCGP